MADLTSIVGLRDGKDREVRREIARGQLVLPGDVARSRGGALFVTAPIFGRGEILRVR